MSIGGSPDAVAAYVDGYRRIGVAEVIFVFRHPFDIETVERIGEVRAALGG
jgi:alkanesulfonate monooxygenase SsuD/methylene tetrahydromethanopterin reductase-like flavin-dependent oxidoreductase (luciferase family)